MATPRYHGIDQLIEETIRVSGPLSVPEVVSRLAERGITKSQVRNAVYRLKVKGAISARANGSSARYEAR